MTPAAYAMLGFFICMAIIAASFIPAFIGFKRRHTHPYMLTGLGVYGMLIPFIVNSPGWGVIWLGAIAWAWAGKNQPSVDNPRS